MHLYYGPRGDIPNETRTVNKELGWKEDKHKMVSRRETRDRTRTEDESSGRTEHEEKMASHGETPGGISTGTKGRAEKRQRPVWQPQTRQ